MTEVPEERISGNKVLTHEGQGLEISKIYFEFEQEFRFFYLDTHNILQTYLALKKELERAKDTKEKQGLYEKLVRGAYRTGKAINAASKMEFDEVIDPKDTRKWIISALQSIREESYKNQPHRYIDSW